MPRSVFFLFVFIASLLLSGCTHRRPVPASKTGDSIEFRLQCVESSLMEMQRQQERDRQYIASLEARLRALGQHPARPAPTRATPVYQAPAVAAVPAAAAPAPKTPAPKPRPKAKPKSKPKPKSKSAKTARARSASASKPKAAPASNQSYDRGMALIRQGKLNQGRTLLRTFLEKNPHSPHKPDALFAIGNSFYKEAVYDNAILAYKGIAGNYPSHPKAPDAMLQIGRCYQQLTDPENARFYLQALVDEYPASAAARQAKAMLSKLSGRASSAP